MEMPGRRDLVRLGAAVIIVCVLLRAWDGVVGVAATALSAAAPLIAGAVIAYMVNILMSFLERHCLPKSSNAVVVGLRRPVCLLVAFVLIVAFIGLTASLLVPAVIESFDALSKDSSTLYEQLKGVPAISQLITSVEGMLSGASGPSGASELPNFLRTGISHLMAPLTEQILGIITSMVTLFFGLLFSLCLLLDKERVERQVRLVAGAYLGEVRLARVGHVLEVLNRSYHGYIVRQCVEAGILGLVAAAILFVLGFSYDLGIAALVAFAGLIPVVGIPTGIVAGAVLVFTVQPWHAIIFLIVMFGSQSVIEALVMPHIGDSRILLPGVWVTVAVTLGGGVCGFLGMIATTPLAAALYQLLREDLRRRGSLPA